MTNIVPQDPDLNRRIWKRLEGLIARDYSEAFDQVWVITGPVFTATGNWLHESLVKVPTPCFMIVKAEHQGDVMMMAFLVPQGVQGSELLEEFLVSVREVEARTGLNLNPALDPELGEILEAALPDQLWMN